MWDIRGTPVIASSTLGNSRAVCFEMNKLFIYLPSVAQHRWVNHCTCSFALFLFLFNETFCSWKDKTKHPGTIQKSDTSGTSSIFKQHLSRRMKHSQLLPQRWVFPAAGFSSCRERRRAVQGAAPPPEGAGAPPSAQRGRARGGAAGPGFCTARGNPPKSAPSAPPSGLSGLGTARKTATSGQRTIARRTWQHTVFWGIQACEQWQ